jgi:hypothetical protein
LFLNGAVVDICETGNVATYTCCYHVLNLMLLSVASEKLKHGSQQLFEMGLYSFKQHTTYVESLIILFGLSNQTQNVARENYQQLRI